MKAPVRRSLLRKIAWLGGDRRLVGFSGLLLGLLSFTMIMGLGMMYGLSIVIPGVMFYLILWLARRINTYDSWIIDVGIRQLKYGKYYAPKGDLGKAHPMIKDYHNG